MKKIFYSLRSKKILFGVGAFIIILLSFQAGMMVGFHKAASSYRFGDNYYHEFEGRDHERGFINNERFPDSHGAMGRIVSVHLPSLVIADPYNTEKVVLLSSDTVVRRFRNTLPQAALTVNDFIVAIGSPNENGEIEAKLIRLLPPPPSFDRAVSTSTTTTTPSL